jgi:hypothetical protein
MGKGCSAVVYIAIDWSNLSCEPIKIVNKSVGINGENLWFFVQLVALCINVGYSDSVPKDHATEACKQRTALILRTVKW